MSSIKTRYDLLRRLATGLMEMYPNGSENQYVVSGRVTVFNMNFWQYEHSCYFAGCAIGHAPIILGDDSPIRVENFSVLSNTVLVDGSSTVFDDPYETIAYGFGIPLDQAEFLFDPLCYSIPANFITPRIVANRINAICDKYEVLS